MGFLSSSRTVWIPFASSPSVILSEHEPAAADEGESTCPGTPWKDPDYAKSNDTASGNSHENLFMMGFTTFAVVRFSSVSSVVNVLTLPLLFSVSPRLRGELVSGGRP